jgi:hypothetical protein
MLLAPGGLAIVYNPVIQGRGNYFTRTSTASITLLFADTKDETTVAMPLLVLCVPRVYPMGGSLKSHFRKIRRVSEFRFA